LADTNVQKASFGSPPAAKMPFTRPEPFTTRPTQQGTFGMSASTHWLATATAQAVLERGGNAFDAAVAGAFVLHVVEPHLNGPGGDMTGTFVTADRPDQPIVLMGQGPAPAGASVERYLAEGLELVPGSGALAAAVPAAVGAWLLLLRDHGTWELDAVLDFAIGYARDGHPMLGRVGTTIAAVSALFQTHWPTSAELWMPGGRIPGDGELVWNPAYARTLERLVEAGVKASTREAGIDAARREWREGFVARALVDSVQAPHRHSSGTDHRGVLALADQAGLEAGYEAASTVEFRGHTIAKTGPGARDRLCCKPSPFCPGSRTFTLIRLRNWGRTPSWRRRSSRSRTGRRTTATRMPGCGALRRSP
jgi:gamma-glutamyltranspeptidase/glutathione hydrolase